MSNETSAKPTVSWDAASESAPSRPNYTRNVAEVEHVERPRRLIVAFIISLVTLACAATLGVLAALNFTAIQDNVISALPADAIADYAASDVKRAAQVLLLAVFVLGGASAIFFMLCTQHVLMHRGRGARALLLVFGALYLLLAMLDFGVRDAHGLDVALFAVAGVTIIVVVVLVWSRSVTRWLRHDDTPRTIPLRTRSQVTR